MQTRRHPPTRKDGRIAILCLLVALASCRTTLVDDPRTERAEALARVGSWEGAAATWTSIYLDSGAKNTAAGIAASRSLIQGRRFGAAQIRLEDLLARGYVSEESDLAEIQELLGRAAEGLGALGPATEHYESALELDDSRPIALQRLGSLLMESGEVEKGLELLRRSLTLDPSSVETSRRLGVGAARAGRLDVAGPAVSRAMEADLFTADDVLRVAGDFGDDPRVIPWLERLVERSPQNTAVLRRLGEVYLANGRMGRAISTLERAAESDPGDVQSLVAYARALYVNGRQDEARAVLEHTETLDLDDSESRLVDSVRAEWAPDGAGVEPVSAAGTDGSKAPDAPREP